MPRFRRIHHGILVALSLALGITPPGKAQVSTALSLDDAVSMACAHHPRVAASEASVEQARGALLQAQAGQRPILSAAEAVTYSNDPVFAFGSKLRQARFTSSDFDLPALNHPSALANFSASATATWTAFDAGSIHRKVESARSGLSAAQLSTRYTAQELAAEITKLYYRVLLAEDQVTVAETSIKRAKEVASDIQDRVHSGLSLETDGKRADLALRKAEDDLAAAHGNVVLARRDLFDAIGAPASNRPLVRPDTDLVPSVPDASSATGTPEARLDVQALRLQQEAARLSLASARATAWPQLSTYGHVENDAEHVVTNGSGNWTIAARLELRVFDGGARRAREQEAEAQLHSLQAQERETLLSARSTIATLTNQIEDLARRLNTDKDAIHVEQEALQTARDRYATGLASITDVLTGESDLSAAEFNRVSTFYELRIANADLALANGSSSALKAGQP